MAQQNWYLDEVLAKSNANRRSPDMIWANEKYGTPTSKAPQAMAIKDALLQQNIFSNPASATAEQGRTAARERVAPARTVRQTQLFSEPTPPAQPGPSGGSSLDKVFAPLFAALEQQRTNANSRYTENAGQIRNIYGQLIGARTADIDSIEEAYSRLQEAAASRGAANIAGMAGRESERVSQNQAVLQSMGVGEIGTAAGDIAATGSQAAQDTEALNQSNWAGLIDAMGATSQDIARADATSFGYRQGEDIARLQGAKEDYLQGIDQQQFQLQSQQAQAEFEQRQQQLAAIASQRAAEQKALTDAAAASQKNLGYFLQNADPITNIIATGTQAGILNEQSVSNIQGAYSDFLSNFDMSVPPTYGVNWDANAVVNEFSLSPFAAGLSAMEKRLVEQAIRDTF